jgi:hypothetical protein
MRCAGFGLLVLLAACGHHDKPKSDEQDRPRRVIEPLGSGSGGVRALPPHAIRADGVGPYRLGASVSELLDQLPSGPRITQLTIPGIVHRDLLRAEEDAILIGAEPQGKSTFVAVVRGDIARTEAGVHVGSTREELIKALGAPLEELDRARDPRLVVPTNMKNMRAVFDDDQIAAIVVVAEADRPTPLKVDAPEPPCTRPASDATKKLFGICLTNAGELVRARNDELLLVGRDGEKPITSLPIRGLVFAAALRNPLDNRDDLIAITRSGDAQSRTWSLSAYRLADGKLVRTIDPQQGQLYQLNAGNARWIGAELDSLDLYLELTSRSDSIEVGGLLTTRTEDGKIRDIVVIAPVSVARRRAKAPVHEPIDAGTAEQVP